MDIPPIIAERIVHKLSDILPYTITVRSLTGEVLCSSEQADSPADRLPKAPGHLRRVIRSVKAAPGS